MRLSIRSPWAVLVSGLLASLMLWPFWPAIVLAIWAGAGLRRFLRPLARVLGERHRAAAALTALGIAVALAPLIALGLAAASDAQLMIDRLLHSDEVRGFLARLVSPGGGETPSLADLVSSHTGPVLAALRSIADVTVTISLNFLVFVFATYAVLAEGPNLWSWLEEHGPIAPNDLRRLGSAFLETGHGVVVGVVGAGVLQALVATVFFFALDVPRAIVLGFLTLAASIVPAVGTALVWIPVAAGLAAVGRTEAAFVMAAAGVFLISTIDNLLRPYIAQRARLALPSYMVMFTMLGGLIVAGPWGFVLGPLLMRLAKEVWLIASERRTAVQLPSNPDPS